MFQKLLILSSFAFLGALARADQPSTHGMALFGDKQLYASHLPMFHAPHDYQLVFELSLDGAESGVLEKFASQKQMGQSFFTLEPERMDLTKILDGVTKEFRAQLYAGHFERGGEVLGQVTVQVGKILLKSKLDPLPSHSDKYLVFGSFGEYYALHVIQGRPNLDHIVKVEQAFFFDFPRCDRRRCPDLEKILLIDLKLPIELEGKISGNQILAPVKGERLGVAHGVMAQIEEVIYSERAELSH